MSSWIGIDIGGANIKSATEAGEAKSLDFPIWKRKNELKEVLEQIVREMPSHDSVAVTMTAELSDCFSSKQEGVQFVVDSVVKAVGSKNVFFYQTNGDFVSADVACEDWEKTAAANWHALAKFTGSALSEKSGFLIDIGSTTTDIIPIRDGEPASSGLTDVQRLTFRELVYAGIGRTPVASLIDRVELNGRSATIARESFATTADVFLWLNDVPASEVTKSSADGRAMTRENTRQRLARMVCADSSELEDIEIDAIAASCRKRLVEEISLAIHYVVEAHSELPLDFIVTGEGAWLTTEILQANFDCPGIRPPILLTEMASRAAPAIAVANLASVYFSRRENVEALSSS